MLQEKKVIVAMSGGVDSSVTAALLLREGYEVVGVTLRLMDSGKMSSSRGLSCCGLEAVEEARQVAKTLGIPHYVLNFEEEFEQEVVEYFCREYARGRTPNPCILCNQKLKFGKLLKKARELGARWVASGHYARVAYDEERKRCLLKKGRDRTKDQSYVLFNLTQEQLGHILLPLGEWEKKKVREAARELGLGKVHDRPDSQELCFIPDDDYGSFLRKRMPGIMKPGPILDKSGKVLGKHQGIHLFTIGQRRGLGIISGKPLYVISVDRKRRALVVGGEEDILREELIAGEVSWISGVGLTEPLSVEAKIRYRHPAEATLVPLAGGKVKVSFKEPQEAITPGQAVVFYEGDKVLGGGWIKD